METQTRFQSKVPPTTRILSHVDVRTEVVHPPCSKSRFGSGRSAHVYGADFPFSTLMYHFLLTFANDEIRYLGTDIRINPNLVFPAAKSEPGTDQAKADLT